VTNDDVNAWFEAVPEPQKKLLLDLREAAKAAGPDVAEELKWRRPCYSVAGKLFCYLHSTKSHATLGFQNGSQLNDPNALLEGEGKDMRHIKFASTDGVDWVAVKSLISDAYQITA